MARKPAGRHKPTIDLSKPIDFEAYSRGLWHGERGMVFDPLHDYQASEREAYKAGFDKAREQPRID